MHNLEIAVPNIAAEYLSINSELQLFRTIYGTSLWGRIDRSVYNKRKRKLFPYIKKIRKILSNKFSDFTDIFVVDSMPTEICKLSMANRSAICSTDEIKTSFGYRAQEARYFVCKLHVVLRQKWNFPIF